MVDPGVLRRRLLVGVTLVSLLGLAVESLHAGVHADVVEALLPKLSLSYEANLPTWFSSSLLLACAVAAGAIAVTRPPRHRHWWGICAVASWMSLDEASELHEHLGGLITGTTGILYYDWVIPASCIVAVLALIYVPFLRELAAPTRVRLLVAATVYIGGALVMELPLGWWTQTRGTEGLGYGLIDWVEETLEMVGASLALVALVRHRQEQLVELP